MLSSFQQDRFDLFERYEAIIGLSPSKLTDEFQFV
jgi:hypothetical protein